MSRKGQRGKCSLIGFTSQLPVWICAPFLLGATKMEPITLNEKLSLDINKCIRTLVMKFRECPYNFFTESDAHSYLYLTFFRYGASALKGLYISLDTKRTVLIHREYPSHHQNSPGRNTQVESLFLLSSFNDESFVILTKSCGFSTFILFIIYLQNFINQFIIIISFQYNIFNKLIIYFIWKI